MTDEVHCLRCGDRTLVESLPAPGIALCRPCIEGARAREPWFLDPVGPAEARRRWFWPIVTLATLAAVLGAVFPYLGGLIPEVLVDRVLSGGLAFGVGLVVAPLILGLNKSFGYPGLRRRIASSFGLPPDLDGVSLVFRLDGTSFLKQSFVPGTTEMGLLLVSQRGLVFLGDRGGALAIVLSSVWSLKRTWLAAPWPYSRGVQLRGEGRTIAFCPLEPRRGEAYERLLARVSE
jgi:hypothetical protein